MISTSSSEDGTSDVGMTAGGAVNGARTENDSQPMSADDAASVLLSMGPILPANPEDTTCYWSDFASKFRCSQVFDLTIFH